MTHSQHFCRGAASFAAAIVVTAVAPAVYAVNSGVEVYGRTGQTGTTSGGSFLSATLTGESAGGSGSTFASVNYVKLSEGTASALADLDGSIVGDAASPLLRSLSTAAGDDVGATSQAGAMAKYVYNGASSATITYDFLVDAVLTEPDDATTSAFLRYRVALVTNPAFFTINENDFAEGGGTREDRETDTFNVNGPVLVDSSISFVADPGEEFFLVMLLQTQAGHAGASADAYNTFTGSLTTSNGTITQIVPEPASLVLLGLGACALVWRRSGR